MRKLITIAFVLLFNQSFFAQTTHQLTANDNFFVPDTLTINVGDTVELINNGYHSATAVDSLDWVNNNANHNGGFYVGFAAPTTSMKFTIDTAGTYYNICVPHAAMGMKSIIVVEESTVGLEETKENSVFPIYPNPATNSITVQHSSIIKIYNLTGQLVMEKTNLPTKTEIDISTLPKGSYSVVLENDTQKLIVK